MAPTCSPERCSDCPGKLVCRCVQVTEEHLVNLITRLELRTVREIKKYTGAGDGCTCCHPQLQQYLERYALAVTT